MAADAVIEPPIVEVQFFTWTGGYIGLQGGYLWTDGELSDGTDLSSDSFDGGLFGAYAGYMWQSGNFVFGGEADINGTWNDENIVTPSFDVDVGTDFLASIRGTVGYAWDRTLLFGTGGVAFTKVSVDGTVAGIAFDDDETMTGWTIGGGMQYAFTDNWIGRAEYRYYGFGSDSIGFLDNVDMRQQTVTVGLGYKF